MSRGIEVFETSLAEIPGNPDGMITYDDPVAKQGVKAYLEKNVPVERKRFTLGHEIGHHVMHKGGKV